jgi:cyclophilin family peptidyl-prolyl cis-trans isomerase
MLPLAMRIFNLLRNRRQQASRRKKSLLQSFRRRPYFEILEGRLAPAITGFSITSPAAITGEVFIDGNNNNVLDPGEIGLPGVTITLRNIGSNVTLNTTTTGADGRFIFLPVQPGSYTLNRGPVTNFPDSQASSGSFGGSVDNNDTISTIAVLDGQAAANYNFAVHPLIASQVSIRIFLGSFDFATSSLHPAAGTGFGATDGSVQPSTAATAGTSSLAGTVKSTSGAAMSGVEVTLTGIDMTGRALSSNTTTDANGAYQFTALQAGTYALNLTGQPSGFLPGQPSVLGSPAGQSFLNGQISQIQLGAGVSGTNYNLTELPVPVASAGSGLTISAVLADDTAGPGGTTADAITSDASVEGNIASHSAITSFRAGLDNTTAANGTSVLGNLTAGNSFFLNNGLISTLAGGTLSAGAHTLHLQATDAQGHTGSIDVAFTLQNSTLFVPTLQLATSDQTVPSHTDITTHSTVTLTGSTTPNVNVVLLSQSGSVLGTTTSAPRAPSTQPQNAGAFSFANINLAPGANVFTVQATDIAGNSSQFQTAFVRETTGPVAVQANITESLNKDGGDMFLDLSDPNQFFRDANLSNSIITINTSAGGVNRAINVELLDTQAPQTVANFLDYASGAYNNTIFHRLVNTPTPFVLQGGGFSVPAPTATDETAISVGPDIPNESGNHILNTTGTLAMAESSSPNSANSQFFFNLTNNTNLDVFDSTHNNGPFTVFGQVLSGADMRAVNTLSAVTTMSESNNGHFADFGQIPLVNFSGTSFPAGTTAANFEVINGITVVRRTEQLTFAATSSDTSVVTVDQNNDLANFGQLDLHPVGPGTATVTVTATDRAGQHATITLTVPVTGVAVHNPGTQTNADGDMVHLQVTATDNTGGTPTFTQTGLDALGLSMSPSGLITGTISPNAHSSSPFIVTVTATDGSHTDTQTFTWNVHSIVAVNPPGNQTSFEGDSVHLPITGSDARNLTLTFTANNLSGQSTLPPGLMIDPSGLIHGTINSGDSVNSPFSVTVIASDSGNNSASQTFSWTVNRPSVTVSNPGMQTNLDGDGVHIPVTVTHSPTGHSLTSSEVNLPPGLMFDASTGFISGTISHTAHTSSPYMASITATDQSDPSVSATQTFTWVVNPVVTVTSPGTQTNREADPVMLQIHATDARNLPLTYTIVGNLPNGLMLSPTGLISGTVLAGAHTGSPYSIMVTASDGTDSASQSFTWTITT